MTQKFFIDESGSITNNSPKREHRHFLICIVHVKDERSLRSSFKRFLKKYRQQLMLCDKNNVMFDKNGKFKELKGNSLSGQMKHIFIDYFCKNNNFTVYCQKLHNHLIGKDSSFYEDKERAFNFLIWNIFNYNLRVKKLPQGDDYHLILDNRNVAVKGLRNLEHYLGATFVLDKKYMKSIKVDYLDSKTDVLIQVADIFANIFFSNMLNQKYEKKIMEKIKQGYITPTYNFPFKKEKELLEIKQLEVNSYKK